MSRLLGVREVLFLGGLGLFTAGTWMEYGMGYGMLSAGTVMLFVAVKGL